MSRNVAIELMATIRESRWKEAGKKSSSANSNAHSDIYSNVDDFTPYRHLSFSLSLSLIHSLSLSLFPSLSLSLPLCVSMSLPLFIFIFPSLYLSLWFSLYLSLWFSLYLSLWLSIIFVYTSYKKNFLPAVILGSKSGIWEYLVRLTNTLMETEK